jgi:rhamnosyltransferase subunit B
MAEFLLMPFGSAGDTLPFIGLGKELKARGHTVQLVSNGYFKNHAKLAGLSFRELWSKEDYLKALENPDIWHPTRGFQAVVGHPQMPQVVEDQHHLIAEEYLRNPQLVVVAGSLAFGARIARETHGIKLVTVHLAPAVFLSAEKPGRLPNMKIPNWWPRSMVRAMYWLGNKMVIHPVMRRVVGAYRKELMLPKVKNYFRDWIHSKELTLGFWPDWFAPKVKDWPAQTKLLNFPFYDGHEEQQLSDQVKDFFRAGPPPVVITFGSAMKLGNKLYQTMIDACVSQQQRVLVLTAFRQQLPNPLPANAMHQNYIPLSQVLPHASCLVHHGGIGTTAQGFRAGIPQLITPLAHDQFDNGERVKNLKAGLMVPASKLTAKSAGDALRQLLSDMDYRQHAHQLSRQCIEENCYARCCEMLEQISSRRASTRFHM